MIDTGSFGRPREFDAWFGSIKPSATEGKESLERKTSSLRGGGLRCLQDFHRLFMLPGVGHCGTGIGPEAS